jgi:hypothetical protein
LGRVATLAPDRSADPTETMRRDPARIGSRWSARIGIQIVNAHKSLEIETQMSVSKE